MKCLNNISYIVSIIIWATARCVFYARTENGLPRKKDNKKKKTRHVYVGEHFV